MPIELVFSQPPTGLPLALVFGDVQDGTPQQVFELSLVAYLPGLNAAISEAYASNTSRPTVMSARQSMQAGLDCVGGAELHTQQASVLHAASRRTQWQPGQPVGARMRSPLLNTLVSAAAARSVAFDNALRISESLLAEYMNTVRARRSAATRFEGAIGRRTSASASHQDTIRLRTSMRDRYDGAGIHLVKGHNDGRLKAGVPVGMYQGADHRGAWPARAGVHVRPLPPAFVPAYDPRAAHDLLFAEPPAAHLDLVFSGTPWAPPIVVIPGEVVVPVRKVYIVLNNVSIRRVDGNLPITVFSASMSLSRDSWTWSFSATLPREAHTLLEPGVDGDPVEIEVTINGAAYRMIVEDRERTRSFGKATLGITCRGRAALLDAPYAPTLQFGNTDARTAAQLMADALTINGSPLGWTVNFDLDDWLVPANAYAHQGSYISALNAIAQAAGGYVQPHPTDMALNVLPAYPEVPWNWNTIVPDYVLPADVTTTERLRDVKKPEYNKVFVSGQRDGVLGEVKRAGTAGDLVAPMVTDALITATAAARQRGAAILSDTGRQIEMQLRLPVLPETGIIVPGKMARYMNGSESYLGIVRAVQVDIGLPQVWQQITVETHL